MKTSLQFVKCGQFLLESNSEGLYRSSGKEKESCCLVFHSSKKHEIRYFHVVVVQRRLRNDKKAWCTCKVVVLHILTYYFFDVPFAVAVHGRILMSLKVRKWFFKISWWWNQLSLKRFLPSFSNWRSLKLGNGLLKYKWLQNWVILKLFLKLKLKRSLN